MAFELCRVPRKTPLRLWHMPHGRVQRTDAGQRIVPAGDLARDQVDSCTSEYKSDVDVVAQNDFCARHGAFSLSVVYWKKTLARNQVGPTERYAIARRKIKPARAATEHRLADVTVIRNTSADRARARAIERAERTERSSSAL